MGVLGIGPKAIIEIGSIKPNVNVGHNAFMRSNKIHWIGLVGGVRGHQNRRGPVKASLAVPN